MKLPEGYRIEEVGNEVRMLKRSGGYALAAFGDWVKPKNIRRVAEADKRYLEARGSESKFCLKGDAESASRFLQDVREAREKYLLALEAAYRGG